MSIRPERNEPLSRCAPYEPICTLRSPPAPLSATGDVSKFTEPEHQQLRLVIKALSAEAALPAQRELDAREAADLEAGRQAIASEAMRCTECHEFANADEDATAPSLIGYGSREWLIRFVSDPAHEKLYGSRNDRMPAFRRSSILPEQDIALIADWLRGDWYEPAGIAAR